MKTKKGKKPPGGSKPLSVNKAEETASPRKDDANDIIIVGIGASAGGLDAMQKLLPGLPVNAGMSFVVVQHLAPKYHSVLPSLLAKHTDMPVETISDGVWVMPDTIYITPPNKNVAFSDGKLMLKEVPAIGPKPSIDSFFKSMAEGKMAHAVGIILSGTGTDGAHGIRAIKSNEGITMAQTPETAKFDGMPRAAIETGLVDLVLPPEKIGEGLQTARKYPHLILKVPVDEHLDEIGTILKQIHHQTGVDYSNYKKNTVYRRISRRMAIHHFEHPGDYVSFIRENPEEAVTLSKDMLISVTGFFRDASAFESLAQKLRQLIETKKEGETFRAWVPGCSTGEEAYTIAMLIADLLGEDICKYLFQIFATDIDQDSIQLARKAVYPVAALADTDESLVEKFFSNQDNTATVKKHIRDMVILARHDLIRDTNFMHLDLISCRNLLIYINTELQDKLLSLFHFSLNPNGLLFLGKSESIGKRTDLFKPIDSKWKIFKRRDTPAKGLPELMKGRQISQLTSRRTRLKKQQDSCTLHENEFFNSLLGIMDCCAVLTDENANIQYVRGDVSPYFKFPQGNVKENLNAVEMARPALRFVLRSMIYKANKESTTVTSNTINSDKQRSSVKIRVGPVQQENLNGFLLIVFSPVEPFAPTRQQGASFEDPGHERINELEQELAITRQHLQDTIEELETSTEELQSLNEELQAANEELQATNEELETSNEELQATNEELNTVNDELRAKSDEAAELLDNLTVSERRYRRLIDNMNEALMLCEVEYGPDQQPTDLVIQQANKAFEYLMAIKTRNLPLRAGAAQLHEMVSADMLKRFEAIARGDYPQRFELALRALEKHLILSVYNMGGDLLGVVCHDVTQQKNAEAALRSLAHFPEENPNPVLRIAADGILLYQNAAAANRLSALNWKKGMPLPDPLALAVEQAGSEDGTVETELSFPDERTFGFFAIKPKGETYTNLYGIDLTERKKVENALRKSEERLKASLDEKEVLLKEIHHRVKNNMQVISSLVDLQSGIMEDTATREILKDIKNRVRSMAMVHEKLYQAGDLANVEFSDYTNSLLNFLWRAHGTENLNVRLERKLEQISLPVNKAVPCGLILNELVSNALKHAFKRRDSGQVIVTLRGNEKDEIRLSVRDNGIGLPPALDWRQASSLGLRLIQMLAKQLRATVDVRNDSGTEFVVTFKRPKL